MYTHALVCSTLEHMWRPEVNVRCLLYSPPPPLLSFKEKALRWSASTAGTGRHCSRSLRGGRVRRTEQWDPAVSSCRYSQPKASHTLRESILFPAQGCLEDISSVWLMAGSTLAFFSSRKSLSNKNLAMPESEFHFREGEEFRMWQELGTRSVDSALLALWVSIPLLKW